MKRTSRLSLVFALVVIVLAGCRLNPAAQPTAGPQPSNGGVQEAGLIMRAEPVKDGCRITLQPFVAYAQPRSGTPAPPRTPVGQYPRIVGLDCANLTVGTAYAVFWGKVDVYFTDYSPVHTSRARLMPHPTDTAFCVISYFTPHHRGELAPAAGPFPRSYCDRVGPPYHLTPSPSAPSSVGTTEGN